MQFCAKPSNARAPKLSVYPNAERHRRHFQNSVIAGFQFERVDSALAKSVDIGYLPKPAEAFWDGQLGFGRSGVECRKYAGSVNGEISVKKNAGLCSAAREKFKKRIARCLRQPKGARAVREAEL